MKKVKALFRNQFGWNFVDVSGRRRNVSRSTEDKWKKVGQTCLSLPITLSKPFLRSTFSSKKTRKLT